MYRQCTVPMEDIAILVEWSVPLSVSLENSDEVDLIVELACCPCAIDISATQSARVNQLHKSEYQSWWRRIHL